MVPFGMPPLLQLAALLLAASNLLLALSLLGLGWMFYNHRKQLRRATRKLVVMGRQSKLLRKALEAWRCAYLGLKRKQAAAIGWADSGLLTDLFKPKPVDRLAPTVVEIPIPGPPPLPAFVSEDETPSAPVVIPREARR